jgi:hypothetical protein
MGGIGQVGHAGVATPTQVRSALLVVIAVDGKFDNCATAVAANKKGARLSQSFFMDA